MLPTDPQLPHQPDRLGEDAGTGTHHRAGRDRDHEGGGVEYFDEYRLTGESPLSLLLVV